VAWAGGAGGALARRTTFPPCSPVANTLPAAPRPQAARPLPRPPPGLGRRPGQRPRCRRAPGRQAAAAAAAASRRAPARQLGAAAAGAAGAPPTPRRPAPPRARRARPPRSPAAGRPAIAWWRLSAACEGRQGRPPARRGNRSRRRGDAATLCARAAPRRPAHHGPPLALRAPLPEQGRARAPGTALARAGAAPGAPAGLTGPANLLAASTAPGW
jgi:hypothetical protein